jgi:alpha-glucosidase (family GH31 glycosyl hydrolase)
MKTETIAFRVSPDVKQEIQEQARELGISTSDYCESVLLDRPISIKESFDEAMQNRLRNLVADTFDDFLPNIERLLQRFHPKEEDTVPEFSMDQLLNELPLSDKQSGRLKNFVNEATTNLETVDEQILARMLVHAVNSLTARQAIIGFKTFVGDVEME